VRVGGYERLGSFRPAQNLLYKFLGRELTGAEGVPCSRDGHGIAGGHQSHRGSNPPVDGAVGASSGSEAAS
jgi:hypothetical protein